MREKVQKTLIDTLISISVRLLLLLLVTVALAQLVFVNSLATSGRTYSQYEDEYKKLQLTNETLKKQKSELMSLQRISTESAQLGFVHPNGFYYVPVSTPLAMGHEE
ncbi:MAG TPA: hypothetical protein VJ179_04190 [Patescibacteria group bacterium]|nr:hypothetical protein [Patescibacteria group bacterium]